MGVVSACNPLLFKRGNHDHGVGQNEFIAVANRSHNILTLNLEPGTRNLYPLTFFLLPFTLHLSQTNQLIGRPLPHPASLLFHLLNHFIDRAPGGRHGNRVDFQQCFPGRNRTVKILHIMQEHDSFV